MSRSNVLHQSSLEACVQYGNAVPATSVHEWLAELRDIKDRHSPIITAVQTVADVNMALAITTRLLEAGHTEKLDADPVWCLIDPLREKLDRAVEALKLSL